MRKYLEDACEEIDACIFSGDVLWNEEERDELEQMCERWLKAIHQQQILERDNPKEEDDEDNSMV